MHNKLPVYNNARAPSYSTSKEITSYANHVESHGEGQENENVEMLTAMMGDLDPKVARRVLQKCNGDLHKAATAILEGDRGEAVSWSPQVTPTPTNIQENKAPQSSVIDLTSDDHDDELSRALEASLLSQNTTTTKFGPIDRAPHPDWAVVPANVATSSVSQDDQSLSRAIEESLSSSYNDFATDSYENQPAETSVREGGRPIALRPTLPTFTYAALVTQALFAVLQVRESIASWRPSAPPSDKVMIPPTGGDDQLLWPLVELFARMDMSQLSSLIPDDLLQVMKAEPWSNANELPCELSYQFFKRVAGLITTLFQQQIEEEASEGPRLRLFFFSYSRIYTGQYSSDATQSSEDCVVRVDTCGDDPTSNDLVSRLSANLSRYHDGGSSHEVILDPSQVIAFTLRNHPLPQSSSSSAAQASEAHKPFRYPRTLFLDQFLEENFELANQKRTQQLEMDREIQKLTSHRNSITQFDGKDTLNDLRASLYYYENLADDRGDIERQSAIAGKAQKFRNIIATVENELEGLDMQITELNAQSSVLFDCPELQRHKYELRAVLMHDGLFGRRQLYSYVKDKGTWWKTVDKEVTEVSEEIVLTDPAGMHLGAGPYMLFYGRALPNDGVERKPFPWLQPLKDAVEYHNKEFLSSLDPAIAAKATCLSSPSSTETPVSPTTSRQTLKFSKVDEVTMDTE